MLEFALVLPLFLGLLSGIVGYGGYFWRAHALQQIANDAARASLPGLTAVERQALATAAIGSELEQVGGIAPADVTTRVAEGSGALTVQLSYDASADAFLRISLIPMPSTTIRRVAAVRLGGL
jgi:Flp pilus assembly protein TadG